MMIGNRVARAIADASETGWVLLSDQLPFSLSDVAVNKYRAKHGGEQYRRMANALRRPVKYPRNSLPARDKAMAALF